MINKRKFTNISDNNHNNIFLINDEYILLLILFFTDKHTTLIIINIILILYLWIMSIINYFKNKFYDGKIFYFNLIY